MDDKKVQAPSNIIQFPTRKKETEPVAEKPNLPTNDPAPKKKRVPKKNVGATVIAVILATAAVNHYVFDKKGDATSVDLASISGKSGSVGRVIASLEQTTWQRDAQWEKELAESLASPKLRDIASTQVGRPATMEEKLRWGTLEEKYTITFRADVHEIDSISFQDSASAPSYVLDRPKFLQEYGPLFNASSSKLKSIEESSDKTVELYTLFDDSLKAKGVARFELDRHKRLLSLKVQPTQL